MAAFSSDSEDYSYQPGDTFKKQAKEKSIEKADKELEKGLESESSQRVEQRRVDPAN